MKRLNLLLGILLLVSFASFGSSLVDTDLDDYLDIHNCAELQSINNNLSANYELINNIDCTIDLSIPWEPLGHGDYCLSSIDSMCGVDESTCLNSCDGIWISSSIFRGTLEGNGYIISGLAEAQPLASEFGLFGSSTGIIRNLGIVSSSFWAENNVGLLVGFNSGSIYNCYASGNVNGLNSVGGLVGFNNGTISNSYSVNNIIEGAVSGGLVGGNFGGTILNSYSTGSLGTRVYPEYGGLIGYLSEGIISNSYWDVNMSNITGGIGGEGKTTSEMKTKSTFINWDWGIWDIKSSKNDGYPILAWQDTDITECRDLTGRGLTYNLLNDIGLDNSTDCLIIQADGITINGNGFTVIGNIDASRSGEDEGGNGYPAYTNLALDNINIKGDIALIAGSGSGYGGGGWGGAISIVSSNITGDVITSGNTGYGCGASGSVDIVSSNITGSIITTSPSGYIPSYAGSVTLNDSFVSNSIIAIGGSATGYGTGGIGGSILIFNSVVSTITSNGGSSDAQDGGAGGVINIISSNVTGTVSSNGGDGVSGGGFSGAINITSSNISELISSEGGDSNTYDNCASDAGNSGNIIVVNSSIINIFSKGGNHLQCGEYAGSTGNITIINSQLNNITSFGGGCR